MPHTAAGWKNRLRQALPVLGLVVLLGYFARTLDRARVAEAIAQADMLAFALVALVTVVSVWLYDTFCLTWLLGATLGHRGRREPLGMRQLLPIKAASYLVNIVNYHAAAMGMAWLVARRKGVPFFEGAGALALLSYLDIIAVTAMSMAGVWMAPEFFGPYPQLQGWLKAVAVAVFAGALCGALLIQSPLRWRPLQRLRDLPPLRPLAALRPTALLVGVVLRTLLILMYAAAAFYTMRAFHMQPQWGRLFIALPIITVVGTLPISVSGVGSTQLLMRQFYAPFVVGAAAAGPVVDAFSTLQIATYLVWRIALAAPFFAPIARELRDKPADADLAAPPG